MNPQLKAKLRSLRMIIPFLALVTVILVVVMYAERVVMEATLVESPPEAESLFEPLEWLYVQGNNVLVWPVVDGACIHRSAVAQYHKGEMVLVVARAGKWVEVESEDQTRLHTHGCISETMLGSKPVSE